MSKTAWFYRRPLEKVQPLARLLVLQIFSSQKVNRLAACCMSTFI
jgi:hypothetical protein